MAEEERDPRSGWRGRRAEARGRKSRLTVDERYEANAVRARLIAELRGEAEAEQSALNPEVQTTAPGPGDFVEQLSDEDLIALYKQLHNGRAPAPKAKRPAIEKAVRAKQAEQAAPVASVGEGNTEIGAAELALGDDERIEDDV